MPTHLLVTPETDDSRKELINNIFKDTNITIDYLTDRAGAARKDALRRAELMLTFNPAEELKEREFSLLYNVEFVQLISAGADHIPFSKIPKQAIIASNAGAYAQPIAEHVLALALALAKRLREEHRNMQQGAFNQFNENKSIRDSTVGILGFGGIGQATADLFEAFGTEIMGMNTSGETDRDIDFIGTIKDLPRILKQSDILVISLPLKKDTRHLIGREELSQMKSDAILINVARGEIIEQQAIYKHLKAHPDFKAGLESWWKEPIRHGSFELDYPFLDLPNMLGSPHNSSMIPGTLQKGWVAALENIKRYLNGASFKGKVNQADFV